MTRPLAVVTGGAGFIGSELVRQLVDRGHPVRVVDTLVNGRRENLDGLPEQACELVQEDVRDLAALRRALEGAGLVFHLACLGVRHSIHSPEENHEVNAAGSLRTLRVAREVGAERFVYVSSSEVYGSALWAPMTEQHPTAPTTVYGASKLAGEGYARAFHRSYGFPSVVVRPFNSFGPRSHHEGDCGEVIPRFMLRRLAGRPLLVFGDGAQTRDFSFVSDTARGILAAGLADAAVGETLNIASGGETSIVQLAREIAAVTGGGDVELVYEAERPGDVRRLFADVQKARRLLGFEARHSLREGLERLRDWYQASGRPAAALLQDEVERNWERA